MVKAKVTRDDGSVLIVMGISEVNVARLRKGQPIYFDPAVLRIKPGTSIGGITLFLADDDAQLTGTLKALIGPATEVISVPQGDPRPQ